MDPLAEEFYLHSPYNYAINNPILYIDPDGRRAGRVPHEDSGKFAKKVATTTYNALPEKARRGVNATWHMTAGVGQAAGGAIVAVYTAPSGVGPVFGIIVFADGSFRFVAGVRQMVNLLDGGSANLDPKYTSILGDVFKSEYLDLLSSVVLSPLTSVDDIVLFLINLGASTEAVFNLIEMLSNEEQTNINNSSNSETSSNNSDNQNEESTEESDEKESWMKKFLQMQERREY